MNSFCFKNYFCKPKHALNRGDESKAETSLSKKEVALSSYFSKSCQPLQQVLSSDEVHGAQLEIGSQQEFPLRPTSRGWQFLQGSSGSFPPQRELSCGTYCPIAKYCQEVTTQNHRQVERCKNVLGIQL